MPVIVPALSALNLTPTSTAAVSLSAGVPGIGLAAQMVHGQDAAVAGRAWTVTIRPAVSARFQRTLI